MKRNEISRSGRKKQTTGALTTADLIVLSLLAERSMQGYELLGEYERQEVADWASVSKAQVYYAMRKLSTLGLIESSEEEVEEARRDRTVYTPTAEGIAELTSSLMNPAWARTRVAQPFSTWLGLSIHLATPAVARVLEARLVFLEEELERERASLSFIQSLSTARAKAGGAIVGLVIRQIEVELEWIAEMLKANKQEEDSIED